jgi:hypothetical protein
MSEEDVKTIYRGIEAFNRRDLDAFLALTDPDVELSSRLVEAEGADPSAATTASGTGGRTSSASGRRSAR